MYVRFPFPALLHLPGDSRRQPCLCQHVKREIMLSEFATLMAFSTNNTYTHILLVIHNYLYQTWSYVTPL